MDNNVLITLYDRQGRKIREQQHSQLNAGGKISMDLSCVPAGLYFVKIASGDVLELEKIVVAR